MWFTKTCRDEYLESHAQFVCCKEAHMYVYTYVYTLCVMEPQCMYTYLLVPQRRLDASFPQLHRAAQWPYSVPALEQVSQLSFLSSRRTEAEEHGSHIHSYIYIHTLYSILMYNKYDIRIYVCMNSTASTVQCPPSLTSPSTCTDLRGSGR